MLNFEYKIAGAEWSEIGVLFAACGLTWHIDLANGRKGIFLGKLWAQVIHICRTGFNKEANYRRTLKCFFTSPL
jgi:hypothetical protein